MSKDFVSQEQNEDGKCVNTFLDVYINIVWKILVFFCHKDKKMLILTEKYILSCWEAEHNLMSHSDIFIYSKSVSRGLLITVWLCNNIFVCS